MKEKILCAAIYFKEQPTPAHNVKNITQGLVMCGHRHPHIIHQCVALLGKRLVEMGEHEQGFLTNHNRFVGRIEALEIAKEANQLKQPTFSIYLYSEDLY